MERKLGNGGNSSHRGERLHQKETALKKLHQMEWKRNTDNTGQLERGPGVMKHKTIGRPYAVESTTSSLKSSEIPVSSVTYSAPTVNAWEQKKGSALFNKPSEEDDDEMLKLALQESLKTAEEDNKRQLERYQMMQLEKRSSKQQFENLHSSNNPNFIDFYSCEKPVCEQKKMPSPVKSLNCSQEKAPAILTLKRQSSGLPEHPYQHENVPSVINDTKFEKSQPHNNLHEYSVGFVVKKPTNIKKSQKHEPNKGIIMPKNDLQFDRSVNDLSDGLVSLTFSDFKDIYHTENDIDVRSSTDLESNNVEPFIHQHHKNDSVQKSVSLDLPNPDFTDTDDFLHNFLRHELPATLTSHTNNQCSSDLPIDVISQHQRSALEQQRVNDIILSNTNVQDSTSTMLNSPLQNVSPLGCLNNMSHLQSQSSMLYPTGIALQDQEANLKAMQLPSMTASSSDTTPGYATLNPMVRSFPGLPQYCPPPSNISIPSQTAVYDLPSNIAMPIQPGLDISRYNMFYQQYCHQQMQAMNALQHQAHLKSANSLLKDQATITNIGGQPQINLPQAVQQHNEPPKILQNQYTPISQMSCLMSQPVVTNLIQPQSKTNATTAEVISMNQFQQRPCIKNPGEQVFVSNGKSQEEMYQQIIKYQQKLNQLQHELAESQMQQAQLYGLVHPLPLNMCHLYPTRSDLGPHIPSQRSNAEQIPPTSLNNDEHCNTLPVQVSTALGKGYNDLE